MLLSERAKYEDIQEKMKKKKLENGLFAREIERYEEQILTKRAQITNNNALLQYWQKEVEDILVDISFSNLINLGHGDCPEYQTTRRTYPPICCFQIYKTSKYSNKNF
jgi:hypothetical protein